MKPPESRIPAPRLATCAELLGEGGARLGATARLDVELLLAHILGRDRATVLAASECEVSEELVTRYRACIARRAAGEPLAYIVGSKEFWSLELQVSPAVLVPRPETEGVVERALALGRSPQLAVVDLGTGSGAIAMALATERPEWRVAAVERSAQALQVARRNAQRLAPDRIEFLHGDWFMPLAGRRFDLIVANPPYVAADDRKLADAPLRYEPAAALTPGGDGLGALRAIIDAAPEHLVSAGWLILEHGAAQARELTTRLVARGFSHVRSHRDLAGHERVIEAQWSHGAVAPPPTALPRE
ncbi:MAG TPA: peptide chain release factor N(5)-glutamine methyltransferase [Steroidobacteraceae bacterium]